MHKNFSFCNIVKYLSYKSIDQEKIAKNEMSVNINVYRLNTQLNIKK